MKIKNYIFIAYPSVGLFFTPASSILSTTNNCINGSIDRYGLCNCHQGYQGKHCDQPICNPQCLNGGVCVKPDTCECSQDFFGLACHLSTQKCINGKYHESVDFCSCDPGYTGESCNIPLCSSSCGESENRGVCFAPDICKCHDGFLGKDCSQERGYTHCSIQVEEQDRLSSKKISVISDNELGVFETFENEISLSDKVSLILGENNVVDASFNGISMRNSTGGYSRVLKCLNIKCTVEKIYFS